MNDIISQEYKIERSVLYKLFHLINQSFIKKSLSFFFLILMTTYLSCGGGSGSGGSTEPVSLDSKTITSFNFADIPAEEVTVIIDEDAKTVTVTVPYGTDITELTPDINITGADYDPHGQRDFTSPVTYTITARDGTTQEYTVIVNKADLAKWATVAVDTQFRAVAVDSLGNVYAVAGNGLSRLVKYNSSAIVQWTTRSVDVYMMSINPLFGSDFTAVAVDSSGNVYAAGEQNGTGTYTYGSVSAQGSSTGKNVVLVKYNSSGTAQWAKSVTGGSNRSTFYSVAVDSLGNVYAAGSQDGTGTLTYDTGVTASGAGCVFVKYDTSGKALWVKTTGSSSVFNGVAIDNSDNVYAAGEQGPGTVTYGPGVSVQNPSSYSSHSNAVLVKYDSSGIAQWARSVTGEGYYYSRFYGVAVDSLGNVYATGSQNSSSGTLTLTYGTGVTATGGGAVLVKYRE